MIAHLRYGLSLLELLVVVSVLALVAATVTVRLTSAQQRATFQHAVDQFAHLDGQLRGHAERHGRKVRMHIRLQDSIVALDTTDSNSEPSLKKSLGGHVVLERFVSATQDVDRGDVVVDYSVEGTSESFALLLTGPGGQQKWLIVAGVTGQVTLRDELGEFQNVLEHLIPSGVHAG